MDEDAGNVGKTRVPGLVSVIIPAYNAERSIQRAIRSVFNQIYNKIELIVINDGSSDDTEKIVLKFGGKIRYYFQENRGETSARNRGFELSKGEFIAFLDHDDYWDPSFLATCVAFLRKNPQAVAVSVGSEHKSALKDEVVVMPAFLSDAAQKSEEGRIIENFFDFWATHNHICAGSALLRGTLVDEAGGQRTDLALSGDLEYWAYLATFGPWGFIPLILLFVDGSQVMKGTLYEKFFDRYRQCCSVEKWQERIIERLKNGDRNGFERVRGRIATWYIFAKVFVGEDMEALRMAKIYKDNLEGKFGSLWRVGLIVGWITWKPMCILLRIRTRVQYFLRERYS